MKLTIVSVVMLGVVTGWTVVSAQRVVESPSWTDEVSASGRFLPPEYRGGRIDEVSLLFRKGPQIRRSRPLRVAIWTSTRSGVLAVRDARVSPMRRFGWDTGLSRVHSITPMTATSRYPARFLLVGRHEASSRSRLVVVGIPPQGDFVQETVAVDEASEVDSLWTAATEINGVVYFYDVRNHAVRRMVYADADGAVDHIDPVFVVNVPPRVGVDDDLCDLSRSFRYFIKAFSGAVELPTFGGYGPRRIFVTIAATGPSAPKLEVVRRRPSRFVAPADSLVAGQRRVFVYGTPGVEFHLLKNRADVSGLAMSKPRIIRNSGWAFVDLVRPLSSGDRLRAVPADQKLAPSVWRYVKSSKRAFVFQPPHRITAVDHRDCLRLRGDRFRSSDEVWFENEVGRGRLETTLVSRYELLVEMPPTRRRPRDPYRLTKLWLRDRTSSITSSDPVIVASADP